MAEPVFAARPVLGQTPQGQAEQMIEQWAASVEDAIRTLSTGDASLPDRVSSLESTVGDLRTRVDVFAANSWWVVDEVNGSYTVPTEAGDAPRWFRGPTFPPAGMMRNGDAYERLSVTTV